MVSSGCDGSRSGSSSNTSSAAMPGRPLRSAVTSASASIKPARLVLTAAGLVTLAVRPLGGEVGPRSAHAPGPPSLAA